MGWCPKDNNPVGQHDTMGDVEPEIGEYTILKFLGDYYIIPTATLRPETIFGVTNIWINPDADYVEALIDNEVWIVSKEASEKLRYLNRKVEERRLLKGAELIGKNVTNPITGSKIPILPASFVNPKNGTGIVMSVPAHAPYDYQALEDLKTDYETLSRFNISLKSLEDLKPIVIIQSKDFEGIPACEIIKREGIKNQKDPKLEKVTQELYAHEFHLGRMLDNTMNYAGLTVSEARERVKEDLIKMNKADTMYEIMNQPVICRCGAECVVKIFENQWFLNYDNLEWKKLAHECLNQMSLLPDEIRSEFEYTINWLKKKACARKSGLGTKLPWDKDWVIESLSDSVIYMAYYILAKYINQNKIT
ncbi:MAG: class I tRNA ligase family protein, partial [Nitrososphaerales archaeon]